jgi:hypothetical protein
MSLHLINTHTHATSIRKLSQTGEFYYEKSVAPDMSIIVKVKVDSWTSMEEEEGEYRV